MEIRYGLISADSHAAFDRDAFTTRMSAVRWADKIPRCGIPADERRKLLWENATRVYRMKVDGQLAVNNQPSGATPACGGSSTTTRPRSRATSERPASSRSAMW